MTTVFKLALAAAAAAISTTALAHVSLERAEAPRGAPYKAVIKVPHGCDDSATHTVRISIPEGFIGVKPMPKAGWTLKTTRGAYAQSYGFYHGPISEGVKEIEWSGGSLPDEYYDEFVAAGFIAREIKDDALAFKVVQVCDKGELSWSEVPAAGQDAHSLKAPAAMLKIAAGDAEDAHDHHAHGDSAAATGDAKADAGGKAVIGAVHVDNAWTRATADGAKVGAGYLTLHNTGSDADTLIGVETAVAERGEIHDMSMTDGVMRMRKLTDGLEIPAGGSVELKPSGMHLMFLQLKQPLAEGQSVKVKLTFKSGATGEIELPVRGLGAGAATNEHSHH